MSRWLPPTHAVSTSVAGLREATGCCPGRQIVMDTGMAIDTSLTKCAGHQSSGERPLERPVRKQRTVNPLVVPARYNFLYSSSRPACGRPPEAAVLSRRGPQLRRSFCFNDLIHNLLDKTSCS
jgi:hypothetical protein